MTLQLTNLTCDQCEKVGPDAVGLTLWDTNEGVQDLGFCSTRCFLDYVRHRWIEEASA